MFYEFHWLSKLHKSGNEGNESLSEVKQIERKIEKKNTQRDVWERQHRGSICTSHPAVTGLNLIPTEISVGF